MDMDTLICNKCFIPIYRGKLPYNITQCGHIFCQDCLQQAKRQCFQCKCINPAHLPLEKPLIPKRISLLTPFSEILETLLNIEISQSNQFKITMERFRNIDTKYEMLKRHYFLGRRNIQIMLQKCMNIKAEKDKLEEQLRQMQNMMMQNTPKSNMKTPTNSDPSSSMYSNSRYVESLSHLKFSNLNLSDGTDVSMRSENPIRSQRKVDNSFYISGNNKPRSTRFLFTSNIQNFMK